MNKDAFKIALALMAAVMTFSGVVPVGYADSGGGSGGWYRTTLNQDDKDKINAYIDRVSSDGKAAYMRMVLSRITIFQYRVSNAYIPEIRKERLLSLLTEIRGIFQARLDSIVNAPYYTDTTPPTITFLALISTTGNSASFSFRADEAGKGYFVALANGSATPTAAQVKAGRDGRSNAAYATGSTTFNGGVNFYTLSGLAPSTSYAFYFAAEDNSGNMQQTVYALFSSTMTN